MDDILRGCWLAVACCLCFAACSDSSPPPKARPAVNTAGQTASDERGSDRTATPQVPQADAADDRETPEPEPVDANAAERTAPAATEDTSDETQADKSDATAIQPGTELFQGWPQPALVLVFTGEQGGYIEPCGCAGLENQKGGLRRRHTFLKQLHQRGWPVVAMDNGGLIGSFGREAEIKFDKTSEALRIMGYRAVGLGAEDLKLPAGAVTATAANGDMFVSANAGLFGFDSGFVPRLRVIEAGGLKIGVTSVLSDSLQRQITNDEVQLMPAEKALSQIAPELKKAKCDRLVLLAYANPEETQQLAEKFPEFDVVVTAHGPDEPPHEPQRVGDDGAMFVEVGHKGMYAIALGLYDDEKTPVRYQRVPLDHRFADSPEMDELMVSYQDQLKELGWEGLGLRPVAHPRGKFAGSDQCADCHQHEFEIWQKSPHAHATETLTKAKPPRQFDPECISCHATGWNAQEYFPYASGYDSLERTPGLVGNGCENCHGPGTAHVAAEMAGDEKLQAKLREALHLSLEGADGEAQRRSCLECHDGDNSPDFDFDKYWPQIAHP